jgi:hypothetical protein
VPEHGHFHLFIHGRAKGDFMHLAALSLDHQGQPQRWFCTNQWVTAERWRPAGQMWTALQRFEVRTRGRMAPVATWITAMVQLFNDELAALLRERDVLMASRIAHQGRAVALEDRRLDVVNECPALLAPKIVQLGL